FVDTGTYNGVSVIPFFRLYHPGLLQHHWTTDANEAAVLGAGAWRYEGIVGYLVPTSAGVSVPLYRLFLPSPLLHLWTIDVVEYNALPGAGWRQEGVVGY